MIKVFWAEDEAAVEKSIKNTIAWEEQGFELVGESGDGELALPLIQKTNPDILITDIKMPYMDGMELSKYIKEEFPDIKIIILSDYDDFKYVQEAIHIGVSEYLLKPVSEEDLLQAVKGVAEQVRVERRQKICLKKYEKEQEENKHIQKMKFFKRLVSGKYPVSELLKEGKELGVELVAQKYNIVLLHVFAKEYVESYSEARQHVETILKGVADQNPEIELIEGEAEDWVFLLKEVGGKSLEVLENELSEKLYQISGNYPNVEYFGGVGEPVTRLSELNKCFEEANYSYVYRYLEPHNQFVHGRRVGKNKMGEAELSLGAVKVDKLDRKKIESFLKTGLKSEIESFIEEHFVSVGENALNFHVFRQYVALDMCFAAIGMIEQLGCETKDLIERCGNANVSIRSFANIIETKAFLRRLLEEAIEMREMIARKKYRLLLQDAKMYIQQNFSSEEISLNSVSASINLSPNHFSAIFRQETGQTFVDYLTSVRMDKARELLRGTSMKTADIAQAVGYKDSHYFSYLFKKTQKCTPREFRNRE